MGLCGNLSKEYWTTSVEITTMFYTVSTAPQSPEYQHKPDLLSLLIILILMLANRVKSLHFDSLTWPIFQHISLNITLQSKRLVLSCLPDLKRYFVSLIHKSLAKWSLISSGWGEVVRSPDDHNGVKYVSPSYDRYKNLSLFTSNSSILSLIQTSISRIKYSW